MKKFLLYIKNLFMKYPDWMLRKSLFVVILSIPVIFIAFITVFTINNMQRLDQLSKEVSYVEKIHHKLVANTADDVDKNTDLNYIKKCLGEIRFLSKDRKQLALLCSEVSDKDLYIGIKERLSFLESGYNKLSFNSKEEGDMLVWDVNHPVEMGFLDIKRLVTLVEGKPNMPFYPSLYRPNIYFSSLKFKRIGKEAVAIYNVDLQILQKRSP